MNKKEIVVNENIDYSFNERYGNLTINASSKIDYDTLIKHIQTIIKTERIKIKNLAIFHLQDNKGWKVNIKEMKII